jgi:hypothetical protein
MAWPTGKKPDKETREKISRTRQAQEAAKPPAVRRAQNAKIADKQKANADAKRAEKEARQAEKEAKKKR